MSNPPLTPSTPDPDAVSSATSASPSSASGQNAAAAGQSPDFDISEEYGTAKKNLPPAKIVLICLAVVVAVATIYGITHRAHPLSSGTINDIVSAEIPGQNSVMVAVNVTIHNNEQKPTWIKSIQVSTEAGGSKQTDDASPAVDAQRYLESLPALKQHALPILTPEARINPGEQMAGTIVVSFPVTADAFAQRKSLTVTITPYDEVPLVLTK
jgi:hypothetical protein